MNRRSFLTFTGVAALTGISSAKAIQININWKYFDKGWELYQDIIEEQCYLKSLNPYMFAGLITKENRRWNPNAISKNPGRNTKNYGLCQIHVMDPENTEYTNKLLLPEYNIKVATFRLRNYIDRLKGDILEEDDDFDIMAGLTAYNKGVGKAKQHGNISQYAKDIILLKAQILNYLADEVGI